MKFIQEEILINKGDFSDSKEYLKIQKEIRSSIKANVWPPESKLFAINPDLAPIK